MEAAAQPALNGLESEVDRVQVRPQGGYVAKQCAKRASNDQDPFYDDALKLPPSPAVQARMDSGVEFESRLAIEWAGILGDRIAIVPECDRTVESKQAREEATMALMADPGDAVVIFNARIPAVLEDSRIAEPDFLVRLGDAPKSNGKWAWAPGDIKEHKALEGSSKAKPQTISTMAEPLLEDAGPSVVLGDGKPQLSDSMQLAHYRRMIEHYGYGQDTCGGPYWAAIIGKELLLVWRDLDEEVWLHTGADGDKRRKSAQQIYDEEFMERLVVIRRAQQRAIDPSLPALVDPEWKSECKECPWKDVCHDELKLDMDHISLLPGITPARAGVYYAMGVETVAALARLDHSTAVAVDAGLDVPALIAEAAFEADIDPSTPIAKLGKKTKKFANAVAALAAVDVTTVADLAGLDKHTAAFAGTGVWNLAGMIDQARVNQAGKVHRARGVDKVTLTRTAIEEDVDIEDCDGIVYMIGVRSTGRKTRNGSLKVRAETHCFVDYSHTDAGEAKVFAEWWAHTVGMRAYAKANGYAYRAYHYTAHENSAFRSLATKHAGQPGVPSLDELNEFLDGPAWIDLHKVISVELLWPTEDVTLKTAAGWVRFSWRDSDPGGANSMAWYDQAVNNPDPEQRELFRARLEAYNADDCEAQIAIRDWLSRLGEAYAPGKKLPSVSTLDARFRRRARTRSAAA